MSPIVPYFRDERADITIYHGQMEEILPILPMAKAIITDPPFSEKTHSGHNASANGHIGSGKDNAVRAQLPYEFITPEQARNYADIMAARCSGWIVWMSDHTLAPVIIDAMETCGRYCFAPLPFFAPGSTVRLAGDGPCSWTTWLMVSRTSAQSKWGTLPGGYVAGPGWNNKNHMGGKPLPLLIRLVDDYSHEKDLVIDPFMGGGTTLRACKDLGRPAIGIDRD